MLPPILPLLFLLGALLSGLLLWGFWQAQRPDIESFSPGLPDTFLWWLTVLAIFTVSVFLIFLFLSFRFNP